jgi:hypothetical protein
MFVNHSIIARVGPTAGYFQGFHVPQKSM